MDLEIGCLQLLFVVKNGRQLLTNVTQVVCNKFFELAEFCWSIMTAVCKGMVHLLQVVSGGRKDGKIAVHIAGRTIYIA